MGKRAHTTVTFAITLKVPDGANGQTLQHYLRDAIAGWKGGLSPDDPLSMLDLTDFTVALTKRITTYG